MTTIELDDQVVEKLRRLAERENRSVTELLREFKDD